MSGIITQQGSLWRIWDFHVHTPASYKWHGENFYSLSNESRKLGLIKDTLSALQKSPAGVSVIMDYWTFEGYIKIRETL